MEQVTVLLAIRFGLVLSGIRHALREHDELRVVGETDNPAQIESLIERWHPDLVVIDVDLTHGDLGVLDEIVMSHPEVKVVMLADAPNETYIQTVLQHGASGCVLKTIDPRDLPSALRQTAEGSVYHAIGMQESSRASAARALGLTERELEILLGVVRGLSNRQIAHELSVTEQTVKFHLTHVYRKLGVPNRLAAARLAYERGLTSGRADS